VHIVKCTLQKHREHLLRFFLEGQNQHLKACGDSYLNLHARKVFGDT